MTYAGVSWATIVSMLQIRAKVGFPASFINNGTNTDLRKVGKATDGIEIRKRMKELH